MKSLSILLLALACSTEQDPAGASIDSEEEDSSTPTDGVTETETETHSSPSEIAVRVSEDIVTVAEVTWVTELATQGYIEFGETSEYGHQTPLTEAGTSHSRLLFGLPASTDAHFRVVTMTGDQTEFSQDKTVTTGVLPNALPDLTTSGTSTKGFRVLPIIGGWSGILIVDELGRIIWYYNHTDDDSVSVQARLTTDGQYLVFNSPCHLSLDSECGSLIWVSLDGSEKTIVSIDSIGHDFTQLSDGTICSIVNDTRVVDGFEIYGDRLVEIDIDGNTHELWNAWDSLEIPSVGEDHDWTHANAINTNEEESAYYVGLTFLSTIIKVDALSGEILWRLGGEDSDFVFLEGSERFTIHHNFELRDNVLTLFSNGQGMDDPSRIVQYELDEDAMTIHETWRYVADPPLFAYALGDVATIEEGTLHVTFSTAGYVEQVEGDDVVWTLGASFPHAFGYSNFYTSLYPE